MEESGVPGDYEKRHDEALSEGNPTFFEEVANLCRQRRKHQRESQQEEVLRLALQARAWLERMQEPVSRQGIREITRIVWAARRLPYKPSVTFVFTQPVTIELFPGKQISTIIETHRPPGDWSGIDYITALMAEIRSPEGVRLGNRIDCEGADFPDNAWRRVFLDHSLSDIKAVNGTPKRKMQINRYK